MVKPAGDEQILRIWPEDIHAQSLFDSYLDIASLPSLARAGTRVCLCRVMKFGSTDICLPVEAFLMPGHVF